MWISDLSIRRPVLAFMIVAGLMTLGWISLGRIGVDLFPKVEFPYVTTTAVLEGASPETMETMVADALEEEINTISGIQTLNSISTEGVARVMVEFALEENVDLKAQDVRDKVAIALGKLPSDVEPPVVEKIDPDASPIMSVMISGDMSIRELTEFADKKIKERLQRLPGVGSVKLIGGREREIRIWLDALRLRAYGVTAEDVVNAIRREHAELPGGRLETAGLREEFGVKTKGEVTNVEDFGNIVVAYREGAPTRVRDVARVEDGLEDRRTYAELDGQPGISLEIRRQSGENTVEVATAIREELTAIQASAPDTVRIVPARDVSLFIEGAAEDVFVDIGLGVILVVLVTFAFLLSLRATIIVAIAMPTALISTFFAFYVFDFTINMMTLMALSVSVGLLVDDAIVVLESIHRKLEEGVPPMKAASEGTALVGAAVLAGTLSVIAVFTPIGFMGGVVGRFFHQYGLAIVFSVMVSLLVSLTLTPTLCARFLKISDPSERTGIAWRIAGFFEGIYRWLEGHYGTLLDASLRRRWLVVLIAAAAIFAGMKVAGMIPMAFDARQDRSEFLGSIELPLGSGLEQTRDVATRAAAAAGKVAHVRRVFYTIGADAEGKVNRAEFYFGLTPKADRDVTYIYLMNEVRKVLTEAAPEAQHIALFEVPWVSGSSLGQSDLVYALRGPDLDELNRLANEVTAQLSEAGLYTDIRSSYEEGKPEIQVVIDRQRAADLGVAVRSLATTVRTMVGGLDVTTYEEHGERYDVRARLEADQRDDIRQLELIQVRGAEGRVIDLANLAEIEVASGPAQIDRQNRSRRIEVFANTLPGVALGTATAKFDEILASIDFPDGYEVAPDGKARRMLETQQAIGFALTLALVSLYMILASQFNSFIQPGIIMLTAPLSFVGAFIALALAGQTLTMFAQIGLIALMGLVMKNGILLIDYANTLRGQGRSARAAMIEAGPVRLRPVLMTAFSTIFGMIPVALSVSQGAETRNAMGFLVIGGLASSTLLTLLVIPVVYTLVDDARNLIATGLDRARQLSKKVRPGAATPAD